MCLFDLCLRGGNLLSPARPGSPKDAGQIRRALDDHFAGFFWTNTYNLPPTCTTTPKKKV
jgi:hypothetical protein